MTLLIIADDEALLDKLPEVPAEVLISCGDLPDQTILRAAQRCRCRHILAVKGNYLFEQHEVEQALAAFPRVDRFVTHNSPRMVHDREDDVHFGFSAFHSYIERTRPRWLLHGHQHVNRESVLGPTQIVGTFGHRYLVVPE
jgi:uncharacterized protein